MCEKSQLKMWQCAISLSVIFAFFVTAGCRTAAQQNIKKDVPSDAIADQPILDNVDDEDTQESEMLPTVDELIEAKLSALDAKLAEQEQALSEVEFKLSKEYEKEQKIFDEHANLTISIKNTAPPREYRLERTEIYVDGKLFARGGPRNRGLPRKSELFFGAVLPGCHEILVKARYVRLKNDLISQFKVNRIERLTAQQTFVARASEHIEIEIEGFEAHNTFANFYRGPAIRFNKSMRPNFISSAPLVSLNEIFNQGRLYIDYITEEPSHHRLIEKNVSIDGLPVLTKEKVDAISTRAVVFDAPLSEGKHTLSVTLVFGEQKWIGGGPLYNFRLKFDRDFYVLSGQTTIVNLTGMPKDGFRSNAEDTRYARATSKILSNDDEEVFPNLTCKELKAKADEEKRRADAEAKKAASEQGGDNSSPKQSLKGGE